MIQVDPIIAGACMAGTTCMAGITGASHPLYTPATGEPSGSVVPGRCRKPGRCQKPGGARNHRVMVPDAERDQAADALMGAGFGSAGERCMAISMAVPVGAETGLAGKLASMGRSLTNGPHDEPGRQRRHQNCCRRQGSGQRSGGMVGVTVSLPVSIPVSAVAYRSFDRWKRSIFGAHGIYGPEAVHFYTKLKTVTTRWPTGIRAGAGFTFPGLG